MIGLGPRPSPQNWPIKRAPTLFFCLGPPKTRGPAPGECVRSQFLVLFRGNLPVKCKWFVPVRLSPRYVRGFSAIPLLPPTNLLLLIVKKQSVSVCVPCVRAVCTCVCACVLSSTPLRRRGTGSCRMPEGASRAPRSLSHLLLPFSLPFRL